MTPKIYTIEVASKKAGVSKSTFMNRARALNFSFQKLGKHYVIPEDAIEKVRGYAPPPPKPKTLPTALKVRNLEKRKDKLAIAKPGLFRMLDAMAKLEKLINDEIAKLEGKEGGE